MIGPSRHIDAYFYGSSVAWEKDFLVKSWWGKAAFCKRYGFAWTIHQNALLMGAHACVSRNLTEKNSFGAIGRCNGHLLGSKRNVYEAAQIV